MDFASVVTVGFALTSIALMAVILFKDMAGERLGKLLLVVAALVFPGLGVVGAIGINLERSKRVDFCVSCHEMAPYGESLGIDDDELVPANHSQNRLVSRDKACYQCHTDYTMFGPIEAKIAGIRHVLVHYTGQVPERIELYKPYDSGVCLNCHAGARSFEESRHHTRKEGLLAGLKSGEKSCLDSGCHDLAHEVHASLDEEPDAGADQGDDRDG